jgi:hypothetical protein
MLKSAATAQVVDCMPGKHGALRSKSTAARKKKAQRIHKNEHTSCQNS